METKAKKVPQRKLDYGKKLYELLNEYPRCLVVTVDNVGSKQIAGFRKEMRGRGRFLFGKNTMIRKIVRNYIKETGNKQFSALLDLCKGNSGFLFTKGDVAMLRSEILSRKVQSAAKAGSIAPADVMVPPGPTGMEPTQTGFFQAMNISTRINRGQIDIVNEVKLIAQGEKVGASEASLLIKLGIKPFYYGMGVASIYDEGTAYSADILDITDADLASWFFQGMRQVAALSMVMKDYPTLPQVPHSVANSYKQMLGLGLALKDYKWENLELVKEILENPDAFRAAPAAGGGGGGGGAAAAAPEPEPESSSKSSSGGGPGLFGGDDSDSDSDSDSD